MIKLLYANHIKKEDYTMKTKKFSKKLSLNRKTIANLNIEDLGNIKGKGTVFDNTCPYYYTCDNGYTCIPGEQSCFCTQLPGHHTCNITCWMTCDPRCTNPLC
jgi:hypothetical protein